MLVVAASVVVLCIAVYVWFYGRDRPALRSLLGLLLALIGLVVFIDYHDEQSSLGERTPVAINIAYDVSLSMAAEPDPGAIPSAGTRRQRANRVLLPLLARLDAAPDPVLVAVTAFAARAETILSWDDDMPQVREVVEHVLTSELLSMPGSSLGNALEAALLQFGDLPEQVDGREYSRFLIIVSDGEQTESVDQLETSLNAIHEQGVTVIALYTGMDGRPEGLAVYDATGDFIGFDEVGGQLLTVPDAGVMRRVASGASDVFVDAQDNDAITRIANVLGITTGAGMAFGGKRIPMLLVALICVVLLRRLIG